MSVDVSLNDLPTLRTFTLGLETVHHLQDGNAYRTLCERFFEAGYNFPQCLSGVDMEYGLRTVVNLRRLDDGAEVTLWLDVSYDAPQVPTLTDLWGGLEWHEREAYDLLGIHFDGHPDLRRILLEDDWTIHPLQRRYDTGGYLIPTWVPKPWPDWEAEEREKAEGERRRRRRLKLKEAAKAKPTETKSAEEKAGTALTDIRALNANYAAKLQEQGIMNLEALAALADERLEPLATALGLKSPAAVQKWRDGARARLEEAGSRSEVASSAEEVASSNSEAPSNGDLAQVRSLNANYMAKLQDQKITTLSQLAALSDDALETLAGEMGLKSSKPLHKWREEARALLPAEPAPQATAQTTVARGESMNGIRSLNVTYAAKLQEGGVTALSQLANLEDEALEPLAATLGLKTPKAIERWREEARALEAESSGTARAETPQSKTPEAETPPPAPERPKVEREKAEASLEAVQEAPVAEKPAESPKPPEKSAAEPAPLVVGNDDLTRIKGIGPVYERKLKEAGIVTFAQLAALSDEQVGELEEKMKFKGRITRDAWREQARALAQEETL